MTKRLPQYAPKAWWTHWQKRVVKINLYRHHHHHHQKVSLWSHFMETRQVRARTLLPQNLRLHRLGIVQCLGRETELKKTTHTHKTVHHVTEAQTPLRPPTLLGTADSPREKRRWGYFFFRWWGCVGRWMMKKKRVYYGRPLERLVPEAVNSCRHHGFWMNVFYKL